MATGDPDLQAPRPAVARAGDEQLLAGLRAGSEAAFVELYRAQATGIYNLCLRLLGSPEDAQDVTQEVFIKACRALPGSDAGFRVRPWLYRVAVNSCYDQLRARKAHGASEPLPDDIGSPRIDEIERAELGRLLEQTLADLSVRQRTVLLLKDVHGLSHAEIAATLSVSRGAAERLLFRARRTFRLSYGARAGTKPRRGCNRARQAVVDSVGGSLSYGQRRRIMAHAKDCPDCRETVKTWSLGAFGLVAFLHHAPLPVALATPPFAAAFGGGVAGSIGASGAGTAAAGSAAGGSAAAGGGAASGTVAGGVAGASATGAAVAGGAGAAGGAAGISTGAALGTGAVIKASLIAVAAAGIAATGGVTVHHYAAAGHHRTAPVAALSHRHAGGGALALPSAAAHARRAVRSGAAGLQGKHQATGRATSSGAAQSATHRQAKHAAGSAAKAHTRHVAPKAKGQGGQTKTKKPNTKPEAASTKSPGAKQAKSAKQKN